MTDNITRIAHMHKLLNEQLIIESLQIIDDSHHHRGHVGAQSGAGHFRLLISSQELEALPRVAAHRKIYQALESMMGADIHALTIEFV